MKKEYCRECQKAVYVYAKRRFVLKRWIGYTAKDFFQHRVAAAEDGVMSVDGYTHGIGVPHLYGLNSRLTTEINHRVK